MISVFLSVIHVSACVLMVIAILLQTGRGAGLSVFGGGGGADLIHTPTGSSFMRKFTMTLAGTFAATSLLLTLLTTRAGLSSVTSRYPGPSNLAPPPAAAPARAGAQASAAVPASISQTAHPHAGGKTHGKRGEKRR